MTRDTPGSALEITHEEVLSHKVEAIVESFKVWHRLLGHALEHDSLRVWSHLLTKIFSHTAHRCSNIITLLVPSDGKVIYDAASISRVGVALCRLWTHVALEVVTTVEELADVTTNVMLNYKTTARMLSNKIFNIEDHLIQDNKLAPASD